MDYLPLLIKNAKPTAQYIEVRSPFNGALVGKVEVADETALEQALANAHGCSSMLRALPAHARASILSKVAQTLRANEHDLAILIAREGGKPLKDAQVEARRAAITIEACAHEALQLHGEQIAMGRAPGTERHLAFTQRVALGPVLAISAFNHPLNLACHQIGPAIAAGNPIVFKPATQTPLCALRLAAYFLEAGLPAEALSIAVCPGARAEALLSDARIRFISFIGSEAVGWRIPKKIAPGVRYALEHGGTAAAILHADADLEHALHSITRGAFYHAGQVCVSTQLLYVHAAIYDKTLAGLKQRAEALVVGDPTDSSTDIGPIISRSELERIHGMVGDAQQQGARVVTGAKLLPNNCYAATILDACTQQMRVVNQEVFGPVLAVQSYTDIAQVLEQINASAYSFQNAIYSSDINLALNVAHGINCRGFMINDSTAFRVDWMPFGGSRHSGLGTGGVKYSILDMTEEKLVVTRVAEQQWS